MSLETEIKKLTAAIIELNESLGKVETKEPTLEEVKEVEEITVKSLVALGKEKLNNGTSASDIKAKIKALGGKKIHELSKAAQLELHDWLVDL
tara:strand:- start:1487 stop:1765 length:279 start_codon:yes stop_codon:yes gene_type:complete